MNSIEVLEARAAALYDDMVEALAAFEKALRASEENPLPTFKEMRVGPEDLRAVALGCGADDWERIAWAHVRSPSGAEEDGEYHAECVADYIEAAETFLATLDVLIPYLESDEDDDGEAEE